MAMHRISRVDGSAPSELVETADVLAACMRLGGPLDAYGRPAFPLNVEEIPTANAAPIVVVAPAAPPPVDSRFSTWTSQVTDQAAKARIERERASVNATGAVTLDPKVQRFATGTRLAAEGYATQEGRLLTHEATPFATAEADRLIARVESEGRESIVVTARELGRGLSVNGAIAFQGFKLQEHAVRGILTDRLESPALTFVLGLRDRIGRRVGEARRAEVEGRAGDAASLRQLAAADRQEIADVLVHECESNPDVAIKLRIRRALGDAFAAMSPDYAELDAPKVVPDLIRALPSGARATSWYDPATTRWGFTAKIFTPTPTHEHAVGEAFQGDAKFWGADNGTSRLWSGGGVTICICLNASEHYAASADASRVHRGNAHTDMARMVRASLKAIDALCTAWGVNRATVVDAPSGITIEQAIPGFWRSLLTDRRSELAGVLKGRTEGHVAGLSAAFWQERRDRSQVVRSDLAQAWTRYSQGQPGDVQREARSAIGDWLVKVAPVGCDLRK